MKVLIYSDACFSDNTLPLYKAMMSKGIDVVLLFELRNGNSGLFNEKKLITKNKIIKATEYKSFKRYEEYCDLSNVYVENCPNIRYRSIKSLNSTYRVKRFIKDGKFDVIHTDTLLTIWKIPLLTFKEKIVWVIHEPFIREQKSIMLRLFRAFFYKFIPKIVLLNQSVYKDFCQINKINENHVVVNSIGPLDSIKVLADKNIKVNRNLVLFWGRITPYKGLEYLCQAIKIVHESHPQVELTIVGGGEFYFDFSPYAKLKYINVVNEYVDVKDLADYILQSAFIVCPYISASQSGSVITSLVLGKPVIGTNLKTMEEMLEDDVTGILVPPSDVNSLATAILQLLKNEEKYNMLCKNIRKSNENNKDWALIVDRYIDFYKRNVGKRA